MNIKRVFFWPDTHTPFHDTSCCNIALDIMSQFKPHEVVFLGDFFDCYSVSKYDKDPKKAKAQLEDELISGRELLADVENAARAKKYTFLQGNHEKRIDKYLLKNASKLSGSIYTKEILKIPKSWTFIPYGQSGHYKVGPVVCTHGTMSQIHVCYNMLAKYQTSVLFGHTHRVQVFSRRTYEGKILRAFNIGWLGDAKKAAEYVENVPDWSHAFALGWFTPSDYTIHIVNIDNSRALFNGKIYKKKT